MADYSKQLEQLAPEARKRVEELLKTNIERELARDAAGGGGVGEKEFSKGWFFSRSRPSGMRPEEEMIIANVVGLDETAFTRFAERLSTLKGIKDR